MTTYKTGYEHEVIRALIILSQILLSGAEIGIVSLVSYNMVFDRSAAVVPQCQHTMEDWSYVSSVRTGGFSFYVGLWMSDIISLCILLVQQTTTTTNTTTLLLTLKTGHLSPPTLFFFHPIGALEVQGILSR